MEVVRSPHRLHVIPLDDEEKVQSVRHETSTSSSAQDSTLSPIIEVMVADLPNDPDRLKESIEEVTHAREVLCTVASAVIKQQAMEVDRKVASYCKRVQDRRRAKRHLLHQANRILSKTKLEKTDSDKCTKSLQSPTIGNETDVKQSVSESRQRLSEHDDDDDDDLEMIMYDDTDEDRRERAFIFDQAYRMKRMTSLVRLIDASQRRLLKELHDCYRSYQSATKTSQSTKRTLS